MKFFIAIVIIAILSLAACLYLPWWSIAVVAFLVTALIPLRPLKAFFAGFIALFLLWGALAWYISSNNENLLAHKMSVVILKTDSPEMLVLVTALVGAIVAGMASLTGSFIRKETVS